MNNKFLIGIIVILALGIGVYFLTKGAQDTYEAEENEIVETPEVENKEPEVYVVIPDNDEEVRGPKSVLGTSVGGRDINAYHFGEGETEILFVGGIHGGYSWNTALVAYELVEYLEENEDTIPSNVTVTVVPVMNPDGLYNVVGTTEMFEASDVPNEESVRIAGRFNENEVDLNRNFDCEWKENGKWQSRTVSGGDEPFSEPESAALRDYIEAENPAAVVVWYAAAGGVYSSNCRNGILPETLELTNIYADASGYKAFEEFNFYEITGDMVNWLAAKKVPAISVLLSDHKTTEFEKNKKGVEAVINHFAE